MKDYQIRMLQSLENAGISKEDSRALRRISITLNNWYSLECGTDAGYIARDEETKRPFLFKEYKGKVYKHSIKDMEAGAIKRLNTIMVRYPELAAYIQGDPRGASLYILRPGDIPEGKETNSYYSNGIALCK